MNDYRPLDPNTEWDRLNKAIAQGLEDTERLDWLERNPGLWPEPAWGFFYQHGDHRRGDGLLLRDAIDAALEGEKP